VRYLLKNTVIGKVTENI